jgi:hypothetical protein
MSNPLLSLKTSIVTSTIATARTYFLFFASANGNAPSECISVKTWSNKLSQPPKRKAPATSATAAPKTRQSKLAKEHNVTAQEEGEIREAFSLFAEPMDGEKHGVLPIDDVKSALM